MCSKLQKQSTHVYTIDAEQTLEQCHRSSLLGESVLEDPVLHLSIVQLYLSIMNCLSPAQQQN